MGSLMSDLVTQSEQSLIRQSYKARERAEPLNGDGFGVGWYSPEIDPTPCVFTSITPAWSNRNLHRLAEKIRSCCFFAHVRAASSGLLVSEVNCHPFQYDQFLWMHNGSIAEFGKIKRRLRESLNDDAYDFLQGTTDSEHCFAVFLNELAPHFEDYSAETLLDAVLATLQRLNTWAQDARVSGPSHCNFAVTDGQNIIVTRYVSDPTQEPPTLYISSGERFESHNGEYRMIASNGHPQAVIVASEPLTEERSDWSFIPKNHAVLVTSELHVRISPIES
jgi:predicted glutamine amidotransferase